MEYVLGTVTLSFLEPAKRLRERVRPYAVLVFAIGGDEEAVFRILLQTLNNARQGRVYRHDPNARCGLRINNVEALDSIRLN
ncbi:hypothetical protein D3C77_399460 [compost metagenome]